MNDNFAPAIAATDARLARYSFGFRPIVVPFEANDTTSPVCSSFARGAGAADAFGVAAPAVCISSHGSDDNAR